MNVEGFRAPASRRQATGFVKSDAAMATCKLGTDPAPALGDMCDDPLLFPRPYDVD